MPPTKKIKTIQASDLYRFTLPRTPRLSPDGKFVVYALTRVDRKTEKKFANLWLVPTGRGAPRQFTYGDQTDSQPEWSPDGKQIAFLSNRETQDKPPKIYLIPTDGGEARPLTDIPGTISSFQWSPDGRKLVCMVRKQDPEAIERDKDENKKKLGVVYRHYDRVHFKFDGSGYVPRERWHIWVVDSRSGKAVQQTDHKVFDEVSPAWSPDGKRIAFVSNRGSDPDFDPWSGDIYTMPAAGGKLKALGTPRGVKSSPSYSPDGAWIAYYGSEHPGEWFRNNCLWLVPSNGSAPAENLTERYDVHIDAHTLNDQGGQELRPPIWSPDGSRIYFTIDQHGSTLLASVCRDGEGFEIHTSPGESVGSISLDGRGERLAYFRATIADPGQVYTKLVGQEKARQLTRLNPWLKNVDLGSLEEIWFKGAAGNELQGWILKPPDFDPKKTYPSILEIHGGPQLQYGHFFMHEFYFLAAQGYVVYFCNPRGGRGYGEKHTGAIWGAWGTVDYDDLMKWVQLVARQPYIDKQRRGVTGGSYGGYMTLWIIGNTPRFQAAVAQRVVSNFTSMWGSSDGNWRFQMVIGNKPPYQDVLNAWERSPIRHIVNARTPTLIIHSEEDHRTPIEQGEQVFVALKQLGIDTEFVRFPGEPHGLSRQGRTDRRVARLEHILRWFDRYLKNE